MSKPKNERYTICVDFDGVIHSYMSPWVNAHTILDPPVKGALDWLKAMLSHFDVVIFSTRCKGWRGRAAMRRWLWKYDTNETGSYAAWLDHEPLGDLKFAKAKPPALIYLDDRAWRFGGPGSWPTKDQIHQARPWNKPDTEGIHAKSVQRRVAIQVKSRNEAIEGLNLYIDSRERTIDELRGLLRKIAAWDKAHFIGLPENLRSAVNYEASHVPKPPEGLPNVLVSESGTIVGEQDPDD